MSTLIAIKSTWRYADRRAACRETWCRDLLPGQDYKFIVGVHQDLKPYRSIIDGVVAAAKAKQETDLLKFPVSDKFDQIAPKVKHACLYAIQKGYHNLVIVDDDTYVRPERLARLCLVDEDIIGFLREDLVGYYPQGSCYVLGPCAIRYLAVSKELDGVGPDDVLVGKVLCKHLTTINHTNEINPGPMWYKMPLKDNAVVSTHKCLPKIMRSVHKAWEDSCA